MPPTKSSTNAKPETPGEATPTPAANGAKAFTPKRSTTATSIPARTTKASEGYAEWTAEVDDLRANLGSAYSYENVPNAQTVAQGIRRVFGIEAVTRGYDKATKMATLWLEYPSKHETDDETSPLVVDEARVAEIKATYHKAS